MSALLRTFLSMSEDPQTTVAAAGYSKSGQLVGVGYNRFPVKGMDKVFPTTRPEKYPYMLHAEAMLLLEARQRVDRIVVTHAPCTECTKLILAHGVKTVEFYKSHLYLSEESLKMFSFAGTNIVQHNERFAI